MAAQRTGRRRRMGKEIRRARARATRLQTAPSTTRAMHRVMAPSNDPRVGSVSGWWSSLSALRGHVLVQDVHGKVRHDAVGDAQAPGEITCDVQHDQRV
jgi:hypothetical protein